MKRSKEQRRIDKEHDRMNKSVMRNMSSISSTLPKKGGNGSKTVWGDLLVQDGPAWIDFKDPNYESPRNRNMTRHPTSAE